MSKLFAGALLFAANAAAMASTLVPSTVYTVTTDAQYPQCCYVRTDVFSNGNYAADEFDRGFVEFDLKDAATGAASLTFAFLGGSYPIVGTSVYAPIISTAAFRSFAGTGTPLITNLSSPSLGSTSAFSFQGLAPGSTFSLDVSALYNAALGRGDRAFGLTLIEDGYFGTGFRDQHMALGNLQLLVAAVPEPGMTPLMGLGLALITATIFRRGHRSR